MQTTFKRQFKSTFTQVPDQILNDVNVTLRAKGLYSYLLTKPDNWIYIESVMLREVKEGRDAFRATIKELLECGYLVKEIVRDDKGKVKGSCFILLQEKLVTEKPTSGNPQEAEPTSGNPPSNNTNINHTNLIHINPILKDTKKENENTQVQNSTSLEIPNNSNSNISEFGNIKKEGGSNTPILHKKNTDSPVITTQKGGALINTLPISLTETLTEDDAEALNLWLEYKKERKQAYKPNSVPTVLKQLKKLALESNATMREIVENSIASNYAGLFHIKKQQSNQNQYAQNDKTGGFNLPKNSIVKQWVEIGDGSTSETRELDREFEEGLKQFKDERLSIK